MHVFVTGATGWIGSATVDDLLAAGHRVTGLARSDDSATALEAKGVGVRRGELTDLDVLRAGADEADAVVHLGFRHDFSDMAGSGRIERAAVETFGETLADSDRALVLASGLAGFRLDRPATEDDRTDNTGPDAPRGGSENLALDFVERGVRSVSVRFAPTVHGAGGDHGFVAVLADVARRQGVAGYVGDGSARWPAVHRSDAGRLVRLAVERPALSPVVHAVAEEGIPTRDIVAAIGAALDLPTASIAPGDAGEHFGWIGMFFGADLAASNVLTRERLGWEPFGPTLLDDLAAGAYT